MQVKHWKKISRQETISYKGILHGKANDLYVRYLFLNVYFKGVSNFCIYSIGQHTVCWVMLCLQLIGWSSTGFWQHGWHSHVFCLWNIFALIFKVRTVYGVTHYITFNCSLFLCQWNSITAIVYCLLLEMPTLVGQHQ